ncbi:hypothetical protein ACFLRC_04820 [Candidatus Altiarchaeota archaeon]
MGVVVKEVSREVEWNSFVEGIPYATVYNRWEWREILDKGFPQLQPHYYSFEEGGGVVAALPLFVFRALPGFASSDSLPFTMYGGVLAKENVLESRELAKSLGELLREIAQKAGVFESTITLPPLMPQQLGKLIEKSELLICALRDCLSMDSGGNFLNSDPALLDLHQLRSRSTIA